MDETTKTATSKAADKRQRRTTLELTLERMSDLGFQRELVEGLVAKDAEAAEILKGKLERALGGRRLDPLK